MHEDDDTSANTLSRRRFLLIAGSAGSGLLLGSVGRTFADLPGAAPQGIQSSVMTSYSSPSALQPVAMPLPLSAVRLTDGPLKHAQDLDRSYLLSLDINRMMCYFRVRAGLPPKAEGYGGWDGDGRNLTGHIAGHYLSAISLMYAATGDERFKERAAALVDELSEVQGSDGYLGALEGGKKAFDALADGEIRSGGFDLNGLWSPWYVEHKIFAGLRDAYRYTQNEKALAIEIAFAGWVEETLQNLSEAQDQKMLETEFGGMGEVLADLSADTNNPKWMSLSDKFEHQRVLDPLSKGEDHLGGLHANTQIPKLVGSLKRHVYTGSAFDGAASSFFWDAVVKDHTFASGGHGKDEYFGPADELSDRLDGRTDESCNVYNMLKLTRGLFALSPDIKYPEFQERALYNHVLASIDPDDGSMCYMVPIGRGVQREYQDMYNDFTCCVGTGMENHALHGDGVYYEAPNKLWVNLYIPSTAVWLASNARITCETSVPVSDDVNITVNLKSRKRFTLSLRRPTWAGAGFTLAVNNKQLKKTGPPGSYIDIDRMWKDGDQVSMTLPKSVWAEPVPDNNKRVALMWGPLMLAGDMSNDALPDRQSVGSPSYIAAGRPAADWLKQVSIQPAVFQSDGLGRETATGGNLDLKLVPFYQLHRKTYAAYWDLYTPDEWQERVAELVSAQKAEQQLAAKTVGFAQPGEMQAERDSNEQGEDSTPEMTLGKHGRRASRWFSFDLPVDASSSMALVVTYCTEEFAQRKFTISADNQIIGTQTVDRTPPGSSSPKFYDVTYAIPATLVAGKTKMTFRFDASPDSETAAVYGLRTIRSNAN